MPVQENTRRLYEASRVGSIQNLKMLIREDPDIIHKVLVSSSNVESPLHVSILYGHLQFTRFLLDLKPELAGEVDNLQRTPLHLASANGDIEIVRALLEKNTSACLFRDLNGLIPLHHAVIKGQIEIMQELMNTRPQSVWIKLGNGQTILHLCAKGNHLEAIKLLTELVIHDEEFINTTDVSGNTVLDLSLMLRQIEVIRYLLSIPGIKMGTSTASDAMEESLRPYSYNFGIQQTENIQTEGRQSELLSATSPAKRTSVWKAWKKYLKYKGDWLQEVQGTMMLVATVIATVTFQGSINPPGGVWQQDTPFGSSGNSAWKFYRGNNATIFLAGTAIMARQRYGTYWFYLMANTISFLASGSVILLIISGFPLRNKICSWVLTIAMCTAVVFLAMAYLQGIRMISLNPGPYTEDFDVERAYIIAVWVWLGMVGVVGLCYVLRFLIWVSKRLLILHSQL